MNHRDPLSVVQSDPRPSDDRKPTVLIVERDPHVRELEAHFLREAGYAVEFAKDGGEAAELVAVRLPDLVITEILLARVDGLALCRRLKSDVRTNRISVLVFSILAASERAREAGADAFLLKPLAENRLLETVQGLLVAKARAR